MKKLLLLGGVAFSAISFAQITVESSDFATAGDTIRVSYNSDINLTDVEMAGANLTWDFSALVQDSQEVMNFVSVGDSPFAYQFAFNNGFLYPDHESNVSQSMPDQDMMGFLTLTDVYNYYDLASGSYRQTGFGANINGVPLPTRYDTIDVIYEFPMNYNDAHSSKLYWEASIPSLGYYSQYKRIENEVDAYGTVILPNGSYEVLRVKKTIQETDSVYSEQFGFGSQFDLPESIEYHFIAKNEKVPVLKVITNAGVVREVTYIDDYIPTSSINEEAVMELALYPNPVTDVLNISTGTQVKEVLVMDVIGKVVMTSSTSKLNVSALPQGAYFVKVKDQSGNIFTKKIIKK